VTRGPVSNHTALQIVVRARKEVILSAGGIHSPQVLQLSGIGPRKLLSSANITTVVDLPGVGQNFQDHPMIQASFMCKSSSPISGAIAKLRTQTASSISDHRPTTSSSMPRSPPGVKQSGPPTAPVPTPSPPATQPPGSPSLSSPRAQPTSRPLSPARTTPSTSPPAPTQPSQPATAPRCSPTRQPSTATTQPSTTSS
jgi:hypothetical protein